MWLLPPAAAAGCRTLDAVRGRSDLTEQQRVGLKYYDDFEQRIPRPEVAECERLVRQAFLHVGPAGRAL
jgi:DNA polymerase lambda